MHKPGIMQKFFRKTRKSAGFRDSKLTYDPEASIAASGVYDSSFKERTANHPPAPHTSPPLNDPTGTTHAT